MSDEPLLSVDALSSGYGRSQVLFDVAMSAPRVGAVAILLNEILPGKEE